MLKEKIIRLKQIKQSGRSDSPNFSLSIKKANSDSEARKTSYEILSAFKGSGDIIIELNTFFLNLPPNQRESYALNFLKTIRGLSLENRYRKLVSSASQPLLSRLFNVKNNIYDHEVLVYVPDEAWRSPDFYNILPVNGAKYYMGMETQESSHFLDNMMQIMDIEKNDYFKLIVFDSILFNAMGIYSNGLTLDDLKEMLGI